MKVHILKDEDFAELLEKIELHYRKRAEKANQPWATSFMREDPRGESIYDQFKGTNYELVRWAQRHDIDFFKHIH